MSANVIAIDGPAYVGKSQISKALSRITGYAAINTGHMYRAVAKIAMQKNIPYADSRRLIELVRGVRIDFAPKGEEWRTIVNGRDWTRLLDDPDVVLFSSKVAVVPEIRETLTRLQREYAKSRTIIMEGRDIGSVVFPDAIWKFFVTASLEVRARRMLKMMSQVAKHGRTNYKTLMPKVLEIDDADRNRSISPLLQPSDAIVYDNSDSPSALQDALVLQYYIGHYKEILSNGKILNARAQENLVGSGNHR